MDSMAAQDSFAIEWDNGKVSQELIRWTLNDTRYEIITPVLYQCDVGLIITHAMHIMHKINSQVGTDENLRAGSYWAVFPRTIFIQLLAIWDTIAVDFPSPGMVVGFQTHMLHFVEAHATDED